MKALSSFLFLMLINCTTAIATENSEIGRGTRGLSIIPVTLTNSGNSPLTCSVSTAHWYSVALGDIQQGKTLRFNLWKNRATGEIFMLNSHQDRMPVQSLWCGASRDAYNSRRQLALPDRRGSAPQPISLRCAAGADRVHCRPAAGRTG